MKPKSVKSFLKMCLDLSYCERDELKSISKLTKDEYFALGNIRAAIQNELGDNADLLEKFKLKYNSQTT